jgi:aspartate aminotransferase
VEHVTRLCINDHSCVNAAAQYAGLAALQGPQDAVSAMVVQFDKRREIIVRELNTLPGFRCADANSEGTGMSSKEAQNQFLEEAGIATVSGTSFGVWSEGYLRSSYANNIENILEAITRIRNLL